MKAVVSIDRNATLKQAEKLLRQGRLDAAIAEYVRLVQDQPRDWNSVNALGDLYVRAGQIDKAVEQFTTIADFLMVEGFVPRAAALYKKILKTRADDDHALLQLADVAIEQELFVDAKKYFRQAADGRRARGDGRGVAEVMLRLARLDPDDADAKGTAAKAAVELGEPALASTLLQEAAACLERDGRSADALAALSEALTLNPDDPALKGRIARDAVAAGDLVRAQQFLTAESAGDHPDLLLMLARMEFLADRPDGGRLALTRLLSVAPSRRSDVVAVGCGLVDAGRADVAFACVDLVADLALLDSDWTGAAEALEAFLDRVPSHIPALMKLVEIGVDGSLDDRVMSAQACLADAYLDAGQGAEARVIAEDLLTRNPGDPAATERLKTILTQLGVEDPDAAIAERVQPDMLVPLSGESLEDPAVTVAEAAVHPSPEGAGRTAPSSAPDHNTSDARAAAPSHAPAEDEVVVLEDMEIDLNDALMRLASLPPPPPPTAPIAPPPPAPDLETVFGRLRVNAAASGQAQQQYDAGLRLIEEGRLDEARGPLELAARLPALRFSSTAALARLCVVQGDFPGGIEWFERAAEASPPNQEAALALLYDLADALERVGEEARSLAVLLELRVESPDFRDVDARIERLSRTQAGG